MNPGKLLCLRWDDVRPIVVLMLLMAACGKVDRPFVVPEPLPKIVMAKPTELAQGEAVSGSYIVAFKSSLPDGAQGFASYRSESQAHQLFLDDAFLTTPGVEAISYLTSFDLANLSDPLWHSELGSPLQFQWGDGRLDPEPASVATVNFASEEEARRVLYEWNQAGRIYYAEPNYDSKLTDSFADKARTYKDMINQNAPAKEAVWLDQINLVQAFQHLADTGVDMSERPLIAVLDSGVDYFHPDLAEQIWVNPAENQAGCRDDKYGCNTTQAKRGLLGDGDVFPVGTSGPGEACTGSGATCRHGTHVAGIIAGKQGFARGGVCPNCQVMAVRIVGKTARGEGSANSIMDSSIIAGFSYISRFKKSGNTAIRVVNASFGKFQRSRTVELLIRLIRSSGNGTLVVAAAGNEDTMLRQFPAAFSDVISVANVESDTGVKNPTSNFGSWVSVAAPGGGPCDIGDDGIRSTVPGNGEECSQGSSMSAPMVAGVAGLLLTQDPGISFDNLRSRLIDTADPGIYDRVENRAYIPEIRQEQFPVPLLGTGVLNAENAVKNQVPANRLTAAKRRLDRVTNACGAVGAARGKGELLTQLFFALPVIIMLFQRRRRRF